MALILDGHTFDAGPICSCCVGDARVVKSDPTGTAPLRRAFGVDLAIRWRRMRSVVRQAIIDNDLLQLKPISNGSPLALAIVQGGGKTQSFQHWFDAMLDQIVLGKDGSDFRRFISAAYVEGSAYAQKIIGRTIASSVAYHREEALWRLAVVEVQGIMEAVSQQSVRAVADGLLKGRSASKIVRDIWDRIDKVGIVRSDAMVDLMVVSAFGHATLDIFEAAGVTEVGLVPEAIRVQRKVGDFQAVEIDDAKKKRKKRRYKKKAEGPGSRSSREQTPSGRTIRRIRAAEAKLSKLGLVNVVTAGDENVCQICQDISDDGPYKIDTARSLIPAHPHCRCAFVPANDRRYKQSGFN